MLMPYQNPGVIGMKCLLRLDSPIKMAQCFPSLRMRGNEINGLIPDQLKPPLIPYVSLYLRCHIISIQSLIRKVQPVARHSIGIDIPSLAVACIPQALIPIIGSSTSSPGRGMVHDEIAGNVWKPVAQ